MPEGEERDMQEPDTEARLSAGDWLDRLDNRAALFVMLDGHEAAGAAVRRSLDAIDHAVEAIAARMTGSPHGRAFTSAGWPSLRDAAEATTLRRLGRRRGLGRGRGT